MATIWLLAAAPGDDATAIFGAGTLSLKLHYEMACATQAARARTPAHRPDRPLGCLFKRGSLPLYLPGSSRDELTEPGQSYRAADFRQAGSCGFAIARKSSAWSRTDSSTPASRATSRSDRPEADASLTISVALS